MKRFIRYLYEYENGKRIRNVGFVKVETGSEETTLHMQGKGFHEKGDRKLVLYLFYEDKGEIFAIRKREICLVMPAMNEHLAYTVHDEELQGNYDMINGILLETESGRRMAAAWDDTLVDVGRMKVLSGSDAPNVDEMHPAEEGLGREEEIQGRRVQENEEICSTVGEMCQTEEAALTDTKISHLRYTKIQRQEISRLPRCEWKLANNQFLVHGYNNYHYLVLIEDENVLKLGVPGIYHIKEAECAEMFGFGEFLAADEFGILPDVSEEKTEEQFGYWCRSVRKRRN